MGEMQVKFKDPNEVKVIHPATNTEWTFYIMTDGSGRRHLDGPHGTTEAMAHGSLVQQACVLAQSDALHAGKVDY